jgi:23S rRNA pseudouridine1911/1915/1917 synthase
VKTAVVTPDLEGPLDRAVRSLLGASWGAARAWIGAGKVSVGGAPITQATARVSAGDEIALDPRAKKPRRAELEDSQVVFADAQLVVIAKPPGVSTIPYDDQETDTLEARVRAWLQRRRLAPAGRRPALGIVHRLDKETSGLVVFTRTWAAKSSLSSQFRSHTVHRRYLAIVCGQIRQPRTLRSWLVEDRGDGLRGSARGANRSKAQGAREAITHVEPVEALGGATLVACRLETGRTHQIRIHLSEAGHPVAGDRVYVRRSGFDHAPAKPGTCRHEGPVVAAPRLMLHAAELGFVHPTTERACRWEQPLPEDMAALLEHLRARGGARGSMIERGHV